MKKNLNILTFKNNNKRQKYLILFNVFFIFLIIILNFNPDLIFFKIPFQGVSGEVLNNFYSSIILIYFPYVLFFIGLDFWDEESESPIFEIALLLMFLGFIFLKEPLEDYFKIHIIFIVLILIFLSIVITKLLWVITKRRVFIQKSNKLEFKNFEFQIFSLRSQWVKYYIINCNNILSSTNSYSLVLNENEYIYLKNEIDLFKNEIIIIKNFQNKYNKQFLRRNDEDVLRDIYESIKKIKKFKNEIKSIDMELFNAKYSSGLFHDILLSCISFKSEIINDRRIISFKISQNCQNCSNKKMCFNDDFFEMEYNEFISVFI